MRQVVTVLDADEAASLVRYAQRTGLRIATGSLDTVPGCHSSAGPEFDRATVHIDTTRLNQLTVCPHSRTARLGPGVTARRLASAAASYGLLAPLEATPDTAVITHALTGGIGWSSRKHGLLSDHITAFEVVDADGNRLRASAHENEDLYWALSGGGVDFVVVTAVETRLLAAPASTPAWEPTGGAIAWPASAAREVLAAFRAVAASAPDELTVRVTLSHSAVFVSTAYLGTPEDAATLLKPFEAIRGAIKGCRGEWAPDVWRAELLSTFDDTTARALLADPIDPLLTVSVQHLGGQLARHSTQGPHGPIDEEFLLTMTGPATRQQNDLLACLAPAITGRKPLSLLAPTDAASLAFGPEELSLLHQIHAAWDPAALFVSNRYATPSHEPAPMPASVG